jgi:hypothetical protein
VSSVSLSGFGEEVCVPRVIGELVLLESSVRESFSLYQLG